MEELNISDASDLFGMSSLLNQSEISNNIKPKNIEKELILSALEFDDTDYNNDELLNYNPINEYNDIIENINENSSNGNWENNSNSNSNGNYNFDSNNNNIDDDQLSEIDELINMSNNSINDKYNDDSSFSYKLTQEQKNQSIVDNVLHFNDDSESNSNQLSFNIDDENREDLKLSLLEKIDNLIEELEDDGISLDKIPKVDYSSDLDKIEYVTKLLMLKSNRNRYATLGEEFILAMASGLEMVCNGDREFLGIAPNLQGYSDVVKVKLRRLRNETSQVVSNVVEKYEISPIMTLLIELIPSLFLHSKRRKSQVYDNLYNDLNDDILEIRKFND